MSAWIPLKEGADEEGGWGGGGRGVSGEVIFNCPVSVVDPQR